MDMTLECWEIVAHAKQPSRPFLTFLGIFGILKTLCNYLFLLGIQMGEFHPLKIILLYFIFEVKIHASNFHIISESSIFENENNQQN